MLVNIVSPFSLGFDGKIVGKKLARCWPKISIQIDVVGLNLANIVAKCDVKRQKFHQNSSGS